MVSESGERERQIKERDEEEDKEEEDALARFVVIGSNVACI